MRTIKTMIAIAIIIIVACGFSKGFKVEYPMLPIGYTGKWYQNADSPDYIDIEYLSNEQIRFEFRLIGLTTVIALAEYEGDEIKYRLVEGAGEFTGTMILYEGGVKLVVETDDLFPAGAVFDFNVRKD